MAPARPAPSLDIRTVDSPAAVETIRELFREYQRAIGQDLCFQGFAEELATLPGSYATPRGRLLLAELAGSPAGCIALRPLDARRAEMKRLFVRPAFEGRGLGRSLVAALIAEALQIGYEEMVLDTMPTMRAAQAMYESFGFRDIEPYCFNPVPGSRYMGLSLPSAAP